MLCAFLWAIPRRLNFISRRFGTLCLFHLHRQVGIKNDWGLRMLGYLYGKRSGSPERVPKRRHIKFRRPGELSRIKHTKLKEVVVRLFYWMRILIFTKYSKGWFSQNKTNLLSIINMATCFTLFGIESCCNQP